MSFILTRLISILSYFKLPLFIFLSLFSVNSFALICSATNGAGNTIHYGDSQNNSIYPDAIIGQILWRSDLHNISMICENNSNAAEEVVLKYTTNIVSNNDVNINNADFILSYNSQEYSAGSYIPLTNNIVNPGEQKQIDFSFYYAIKMNNVLQLTGPMTPPSEVELKLLLGDRHQVDQAVLNNLLQVTEQKKITFPRCPLNLTMDILPATVDFGDLIFDSHNAIQKRKNFSVKLTRDTANGCTLNHLNLYRVDMYFSTPFQLDADDEIDIGNGLGLRLTRVRSSEREPVKFNSQQKMERIMVSGSNNVRRVDFEAEIATNNGVIRPGPFDVPVTINIYYH
nr:hypothetical protein [uncultured Moellerella sp.]